MTKQTGKLQNDEERCPKCFSIKIYYGFSVGEPMVGCLNCGHEWEGSQ